MEKIIKALLTLFKREAPSTKVVAPSGGLDVRKIAKDIVSREGGYVNDPDDLGGATNYGVTIGTLQSLKKDLNGDGKVNIADVKLVSKELAEEIFLEYYFRKPQINKLPVALQATVFDMQVNAGNNAIKVLQRLVGVKDDGAIGPATLKAVEAFAKGKTATQLSDAYGIARRNYYYALADARPASRKYAKRKDGGKGGWIVRAEEFISPKLRLTDAEHKARVSAWK